MRIVLSVFAVLLAIIAGTPASARQHHRAQHVTSRHVVITQKQQPEINFFKMPLFSDVASYGRSPAMQHVVARAERTERASHRHIVMSLGHEATTPRATTSTEPMSSFEASGVSRPSDCYGIPWCGCFLRHHFGMADRGLNLARNWAHVGASTSPHAGAVIVWRGHVGVLQSDPDASGRAMVLSGNDSYRDRNHAHSVMRSIRGAIAFRQL